MSPSVKSALKAVLLFLRLLSSLIPGTRLHCKSKNLHKGYGIEEIYQKFYDGRLICSDSLQNHLLLQTNEQEPHF